MADDNPPQKRPPVKMGLRVVARHAAGRHGGRELARDVTESHRPKLLDASTRLARPPGRHPPPPAPPAPPAFSPPPELAEPAPAFSSPPEFDDPTAGLSPSAPSVARAPAPPPPAPAPPTVAREPAAPAAPGGGPSQDKIAAAGLSPFAAQWLFGDQAS